MTHRRRINQLRAARAQRRQLARALGIPVSRHPVALYYDHRHGVVVDSHGLIIAWHPQVWTWP